MTDDLTRSLHKPQDAEPYEPMPRREWLVTNGLGGYASGTVAGVITRRYHGLLVSALPAPLGRMVMLNHLLERIRLTPATSVWLGEEQDVAGPNAVDRAGLLTEFRLELGLPTRWRGLYEDAGEKARQRHQTASIAPLATPSGACR